MPEPGDTKPDVDKPPPERPTLSPDQIAAERKRGRIAGVAAFLAIGCVLASTTWARSVDSDDTGTKPLIGGQPVGVATKQALDKAQDTLDAAKKNANAGSKSKQSDDSKKKGAQDVPSVATAQKQRDEVEKQKDRVESLAATNEHANTAVALGLLLSLGLLFLIVPFLHIYRATRARRPETFAGLGLAAVVGPLALAVSTLLHAITLKDAASKLVVLSFPDLAAASAKGEDLLQGGAFLASTTLGIIGAVAIIFWLIKCNYDALNTGLLPKTIAVIGMALPLLTFIVAPLVLFWVLALGGLCLGLWPGGLPPAWTEGRAIPWPKRQPGGGGGGFFKQSPPSPPAQSGGERNGEVEAVGPGLKSGDSDGDAELDADEDNGEVSQPHSASRKKRKRRN